MCSVDPGVYCSLTAMQLRHFSTNFLQLDCHNSQTHHNYNTHASKYITHKYKHM